MANAKYTQPNQFNKMYRELKTTLTRFALCKDPLLKATLGQRCANMGLALNKAKRNLPPGTQFKGA